MGGMIVSAAAHAAFLAVGRLPLAATGEGPVADRDPPTMQPPPDRAAVLEPLEVVEIREPFGRSGAPAVRAAQPATAASIVAPVPATLRGAIPDPIRMLEKIEVAEAQKPAVATYATVADYLVEARPNARPFRPIDDRPVEVLAGIAARLPTGTASAGMDADCPPGHGGLRR